MVVLHMRQLHIYPIFILSRLMPITHLSHFYSQPTDVNYTFILYSKSTAME